MDEHPAYVIIRPPVLRPVFLLFASTNSLLLLLFASANSLLLFGRNGKVRLSTQSSRWRSLSLVSWDWFYDLGPRYCRASKGV